MTGRGRLTLALGCLLYAVAWLAGARTLYPVAVGLVAAPLGAALWVRTARRPLALEHAGRDELRLEGDDVVLRLRTPLSRGVRPPALMVTERLGRLGEHRVALRVHGRNATGTLQLERVARGRYPFTAAHAVVEDPFGLARVELPVADAGALLVHPRLVPLERVFSRTGRRAGVGARLSLRRPSGFDFHGVREHQPGESLRRVHWPSTAKRGQLMVKEFEDAPRDELAVVLDAAAGAAAGPSFDVQVRAAASLLHALGSGGRSTLLAINRRRAEYHRVASERDWRPAYDALAAAEPDGMGPLVALLSSDAGPLSHVAEVVVVTSVLTRTLVEHLARRATGGRRAALVLVDAASFAGRSAPPPGELFRLAGTGVPVAVVRRGDDLAAALGVGPLEAAGA